MSCNKNPFKRTGLSNELYDSGLLDDWKTAKQLAEETGYSVDRIGGALSTLNTNGLLSRKSNSDYVSVYRKAQVHWVFKTPISANPPSYLQRVWR